DLNAKIRDANADLTVNVGFMGGRVRAKALARADSDGALDVRAAGVIRDVAADEIMASLYYPDYISGLPMDADVYVKGSGKDLSELMGSITGSVRGVSSAGGYAHEKLISVLYGRDFLTSIKEGVEGIFSGRKKQMPISCAAANLKIREGRFEMDKNVAVQTKAVNMRAVGWMDFANETMSISLNTTPVEGIKWSMTGNLVNSMEFAGNLAEPDLQLNRAAVAEKLVTAAGGAVVAAGLLTGGVGLLVGAGVGLVGREVIQNLREDDSPCRTAFGAGAPKSERGDPAFMIQPVDKLAQNFIDD
ncbi:MAG: AsmA-like C-terminal region-containing protein, partial [Rickettsiales bacterium]|nr:AsmA-like C-terminal region-containing protein [Rickettsiales bacterium]